MKRQHLLALITLLAAPVFALAGSLEAPEGPSQPASFGAPVSDTTLSEYRGTHDFTFNEQNTKGHLYNNKAANNVSGHNVVSGDAFSGMSGFSTVIQNSGNNVLIQNATIVNVKVQ